MIALNPQYITDSFGKKVSAIISINEFTKILEILENIEDKEDIKLYDEAKNNDDGERIAMESVFEQIENQRKSLS